MKGFQFRLQAVLTLREQDEQVAQQNCARAYAAVAAASARLRGAEEAIATLDESRRAQLAASTRADLIEHLRAFGVLLEERRAGQVLELEEARRRAEEAWRLLIIATQRREALERLRRRQRIVHVAQAARVEQKILDELAGRGSRLADAWREAAVDV